MDKIEGRHWVFIVGILSMVITSIWSPEVAGTIGGVTVLHWYRNI